ncbi:MAG: hypothetical protein JSV43_06465 [Methanobacteriota archaeon]|nr:MAG: hypothetical protein JSV43_06465 [Euryarchaeota archaeon]
MTFRRRITSLFTSFRRRKKVRIRHVVEIHEAPVKVKPLPARKRLLKTVKAYPRVVGTQSIDHEKHLLALGWEQVKNGFRGYLDYNGRPIRALLKRRYGREYQIFLFRPPMEAFDDHDEQCLNYSGRGWFYVHMEKGKEGNGNPIALINCVQDKLSNDN